jgi:glycosyltransferase involved in cell wall biosynthesis
MARAPISIVVHARNSAATLPRALASVAWADEILVVDMASQDDTREIAAAAGARVLSVAPHPRIDAVRNRFLPEAAHDWIFVLDSDEHLPDDAADAIRRLVAEQGGATDAFGIPRFNWFGDRLLRGSGWYPDHQIRLFRKGKVAWSDSQHRRPTVLTGADRLMMLEPPGCLHIHHRNYTDLGHLIAKQVAYARNDVYPENPDEFHFEAYVAEAFAEYHRRLDRDRDGDYSVALATVMAWDKIVRGLIHWERLGRTVPLPDMFSLPVVLEPRSQPAPRPKRSVPERVRREIARVLRRLGRRR